MINTPDDREPDLVSEHNSQPNLEGLYPEDTTSEIDSLFVLADTLNARLQVHEKRSLV